MKSSFGLRNNKGKFKKLREKSCELCLVPENNTDIGLSRQLWKKNNNLETKLLDFNQPVLIELVLHF